MANNMNDWIRDQANKSSRETSTLAEIRKKLDVKHNRQTKITEEYAKTLAEFEEMALKYPHNALVQKTLKELREGLKHV